MATEKTLTKRWKATKGNRIGDSDRYYCGEQAEWAIKNHGKVKIGRYFYHPLTIDGTPYYGRYLERKDADTLAKIVKACGFCAIVQRASVTDPRYVVYVRRKQA